MEIDFAEVDFRVNNVNPYLYEPLGVNCEDEQWNDI